MRRTVLIAFVPVALAAAGCGGGQRDGSVQHASRQVPLVSARAIRSPVPGPNMDTNPANLASAVVTHAFGQLPQYIDDATFRLLPYDMFRAFQPGGSHTQTIRLTTPRTNLVLDTVVTSGLTEVDARENARPYTVKVTLDERLVPQIDRYWLYYRNNGPSICRIYFPGDLGSLHMAVHSLVLRPLAAGPHEIRVAVVRHAPGAPVARFVTRYLVHTLARGPSKAERESAPADDGPKPSSRTPLTFLAANTRR